MPRPYEDPTLATLEAAQQLGVKDYATGADSGWSPAAKKRWVERLEALATGREKEDARLRNQAKYMAEAPVLNDVRLGIEAGRAVGSLAVLRNDRDGLLAAGDHFRAAANGGFERFERVG